MFHDFGRVTQLRGQFLLGWKRRPSIRRVQEHQRPEQPRVSTQSRIFEQTIWARGPGASDLDLDA